MGDRAEGTLLAAGRISEFLHSKGVDHAVIGAVAMAAHGYARQTMDLDFASCADPFAVLPEIGTGIREMGFEVEVVLPDADDPLGGVLNITGSDIDLIQIVNFLNPWTAGAAALARDTIRTAVTIADSVLPVADVAHLVALKLYAGGPLSRADILALLAANALAEIAEIEKICAQFGLAPEFASLRAEL